MQKVELWVDCPTENEEKLFVARSGQQQLASVLLDEGGFWKGEFFVEVPQEIQFFLQSESHLRPEKAIRTIPSRVLPKGAALRLLCSWEQPEIQEEIVFEQRSLWNRCELSAGGAQKLLLWPSVIPMPSFSDLEVQLFGVGNESFPKKVWWKTNPTAVTAVEERKRKPSKLEVDLLGTKRQVELLYPLRKGEDYQVIFALPAGFSLDFDHASRSLRVIGLPNFGNNNGLNAALQLLRVALPSHPGRSELARSILKFFEFPEDLELQSWTKSQTNTDQPSDCREHLRQLISSIDAEDEELLRSMNIQISKTSLHCPKCGLVGEEERGPLPCKVIYLPGLQNNVQSMLDSFCHFTKNVECPMHKEQVEMGCQRSVGGETILALVSSLYEGSQQTTFKKSESYIISGKKYHLASVVQHTLPEKETERGNYSTVINFSQESQWVSISDSTISPLNEEPLVGTFAAFLFKMDPLFENLKEK